MRFYIHSEEEPSFALPVQWDDADTRPVEALLQHFLAAYAAKGGKRSAAQIALSSSDGRLLAPKARVLAVVEDGGDVFAVERPSGAAASASASASAKAPARSAAPAADSEAEALQKVLAPYLDAAQKAWDARGYRQAKEIYGELLTVHPKLPVALRRLGEIELLCGRADSAVDWLLKAAWLGLGLGIGMGIGLGLGLGLGRGLHLGFGLGFGLGLGLGLGFGLGLG